MRTSYAHYDHADIIANRALPPIRRDIPSEQVHQNSSAFSIENDMYYQISNNNLVSPEVRYVIQQQPTNPQQSQQPLPQSQIINNCVPYPPPPLPDKPITETKEYILLSTRLDLLETETKIRHNEILGILKNFSQTINEEIGKRVTLETNITRVVSALQNYKPAVVNIDPISEKIDQGSKNLQSLRDDLLNVQKDHEISMNTLQSNISHISLNIEDRLCVLEKTASYFSSKVSFLESEIKSNADRIVCQLNSDITRIESDIKKTCTKLAKMVEELENSLYCKVKKVEESFEERLKSLTRAYILNKFT